MRRRLPELITNNNNQHARKIVAILIFEYLNRHLKSSPGIELAIYQADNYALRRICMPEQVHETGC